MERLYHTRGIVSLDFGHTAKVRAYRCIREKVLSKEKNLLNGEI